MNIAVTSPHPPICGTLLQRPESVGLGGEQIICSKGGSREWGQMRLGRRSGAQSLRLIFGWCGGMGVFKLGRKVVSLETTLGASLAAQWLALCTAAPGDTALIPVRK